jgi:ADP-ribose pyrophosphatase YjhB (NUDIX family)
MMLRWVYFLYGIWRFFVRPVVVGVRVMMIRNEEVLLVHHTYVPGWYMPGGGLNRGETLEQGARREAAEEVGAELHNLSLVGAYSNFKEWRSDHNILFLSTDFSLSGERDRREIAEVRFFPLDALPEDLWPGHRLRLEEYRSGHPSPQFGEW